MRLVPAIIAVLIPLSVCAADPSSVQLQLNDGRIVQGVVDASTSDQTVWLRSQSPGVVLLSGHDWKDIASVRAGDGQPIVDDKIARVLAMRSKNRVTVIEPAQPVAVKVNKAARIRSATAYGQLANFDRDTAIDGLRVVVAPTDGTTIIPVNAIVEIELLAERTMPTRRSMTNTRFQRIAKWTRRIQVDQFQPDGAVLNLPFQQIRPGRQTDISPDGLIVVRVKVPGVGAFDAADQWVRLTPPSRFLDRLQLHTGSREVPYGTSRLTPARRRPLYVY